LGITDMFCSVGIPTLGSFRQVYVICFYSIIYFRTSARLSSKAQIRPILEECEIPTDRDISGASDDTDEDQYWVPVTTRYTSSDDEDLEPVAETSHLWELPGGDAQGGQSSFDDETQLPDVSEVPQAGSSTQAKRRKRSSGGRNVWHCKIFFFMF